VVRGITLVTLRWTDGEALLPADDRVYHKAADGLTRNDHFRAMLQAARARGVAPECVVSDRRRASLGDLKASRAHGWRRLPHLPATRLVDPDGAGNRPLADRAVGERGTRGRLPGDGVVRVCRSVAPDGDAE
jgi:hypothetical protein